MKVPGLDIQTVYLITRILDYPGILPEYMLESYTIANTVTCVEVGKCNMNKTMKLTSLFCICITNGST